MLKTIRHKSFPHASAGKSLFDPSNGCYHHGNGYHTSWFAPNRSGDGWHISEWGEYIDSAWSAPLCNFLSDYTGSDIVEFIEA